MTKRRLPDADGWVEKLPSPCPVYTHDVRRLALSIIVALLTFSAAGAYALVITEPCTGYEQPGQDDGGCPPTCVTCGCCAQAAEPAIVPVGSSLEAPVSDISPLIPHAPKVNPRDILHVPKVHLA